MRHTSQRIQSVQAPIIPIVAGWTRSNPGTISLGQGVVSYGPPTAAIDAINHFPEKTENNLYGPAQGIPRLQELIAEKLLSENRIDCDRGYKIIVTAGSNMAFLNAMLAITDPDDEVILPLPYYFNQEMAIRMVNCHPIAVPTDSNYQLNIEAIRQAITKKTRAIITISPNNPTGAVYSEQSLRAINQLCEKHDLYHISDEAYEYFTYLNTRHVSPGSFADAQRHTISLFSLSKAYGFASWRIGYMIVPEELYDSILKVQDTNLICPPLISQHAAIGALETGSEFCRQKLEGFSQVRTTLLKSLTHEKELCHTVATDGAFYLLLKIHTEMDDLSLVKKLITEFKVGVIPGSAFGLKDGCYLRISYGMLDQTSSKIGIRRLVDGLTSILF